MKKVFLIIIVFLFFASLQLLGQEKWKRVVNREGITVSVLKHKGGSDEFLARMSIKANIKEVYAVLNDIPSFTKWMPRTIKSIVLEKGENYVIFYNEVKTPWPLENRDVITKFTDSFGKNFIKRDVSLVAHKKCPPKKGLVRMPELKGYWLFTQRGDFVDIAYRIRSNPGGNIPISLANGSSKKVPYITLKNLRKIILSEKKAK